MIITKLQKNSAELAAVLSYQTGRFVTETVIHMCIGFHNSSITIVYLHNMYRYDHRISPEVSERYGDFNSGNSVV